MTSLGPFIGHVTASTVIIWGRRGLPAEDLAFDATTQVSISMKKKDEESSSSSTFTAKRADDNVFRFALEGLEAKTHYVATVTGFFDEPRTCEFSTRPDPQSSDPVSFLLGSCRAPDEYLYASQGDRIFRAMTNEKDISFNMFCGDQIYADLNCCGFFNPRFWLKRPTQAHYYKKYHTAFSKPNFHELMRKTPTYMMPDDHEFVDNFFQDGDEKYWNNGGAQSALAYQILSSPISDVVTYPQAPPRGIKLYYNFEHNLLSRLFVLECRTERSRPAGKPPCMISEEQEGALYAWMASPPKDFDGVTFVVSSVPVFPDVSKDQWTGFPQQRARIMDKISEINSQRTGAGLSPLRVCFLAGDIHQANYSKMVHPDSGTAVLSLISSPLCWNGLRGEWVQRMLKCVTNVRCIRNMNCAKGRFYKTKGLSPGWKWGYLGKFIQGRNYMRIEVREKDTVAFTCKASDRHVYFQGTMNWDMPKAKK